ncbi:MAG: glycosyl transferase [Deltaproteobacteria bacterium HGW-Deltaproteobacteria-23]|nr:MAG: glycosyl transferase [Deltaproteobacteria bacterium HGW-Deltaproteobacteria-23]
MTAYPLDIIIPVWNRPVEVRAALAAFVAASPQARLVMVNNGSERETESILHEFAEALDDRALLVAAERNIGSVAALNLGLAKSTAPLALVTTPFIKVEPGWFDAGASLFATNPDAGSAAFRKNGGSASPTPLEADHGSFEAMLLRRALYDAIGGFDETMDGGEWALRDFARRSFKGGFKTFSLSNKHIHFLQQRELGSALRREERTALARESYIERWGEPSTFLLNCPESLFGLQLDELKSALLHSVRQGNQLIVVAGSKIAKALLAGGFSNPHENITLQPLPRFFSSKALKKTVEQAASNGPLTIIVSEAEIADKSLQSISFSDFMLLTQQRSERYYQRGTNE